MDFTFKIFAQPLVALVPMALIFVAYFSHQKLPLGLPGGMVAIADRHDSRLALGTMNGEALTVQWSLSLPAFAGGSLWEALTHPAFLNYFSVIFPMGIFNVVGSLQNIESAEAAGDRYQTFPSLMANGIGSVVAALFGSVFPTTIYIGHPGWKRLGARSGYSALNGIFIGFSLSHRDDSGGARSHSIRGGYRHPALYRHHHRRPVVSGNTEGACAGGGAGNGSGIGGLGIDDG